MSSIRENIENNIKWNVVLIGFEKQIGEVEFDKANGFYYIYPKGKLHIYENQLTTLPMASIESIVSFMQGALFIDCQNGKEQFKEG